MEWILKKINKHTKHEKDGSFDNYIQEGRKDGYKRKLMGIYLKNNLGWLNYNGPQLWFIVSGSLWLQVSSSQS